MPKNQTSPYESEAGRGTGEYLTKRKGAEADGDAPVEPRPRVGYSLQPAGAVQDDPPDSSLLGAVLVTLFCFLPFGLVAIAYALRVRPRWKRGDETGARHAAQMAERWTFAAVGLFVIVFVIAAIAAGVMYFVDGRKGY